MLELDDHDIHLSVVVPAFNEVGRITRTVGEIADFLSAKPWSWEVLVVDDGSSDGTGDAVRASHGSHPGIRTIRKEPNAGKGRAVRTGILAARGRHILFSDADLSTPIEEVDRCHDSRMFSQGLPAFLRTRFGYGRTRSQPCWRVRCWLAPARQFAQS